MRASSSLALAVLVLALTLPALRYLLHLSLPLTLLLSLTLAYLPSYLDGSEYDPDSGRYSPTFQRLPLWTPLLSACFPARLLLDAPTPLYTAQPQYILAVHPHGILTCNHFIFMTDALHFLSSHLLHDRRDIGATVLFRIPLFRDLLLALGVVDASADVCHRVLRSGRSLQLYPGGEKEQLMTGMREGEAVVVASGRRGFVRLAVQYNVPIVPAYAFGEDRLYAVSGWGLQWRLWVASRLRVALPLAWGRWWLPIWPRQRPLVLVLGAPFTVEGEGTGEERVDRGLRQYCEALASLYQRHQGSMPGYEKTPLHIL